MLLSFHIKVIQRELAQGMYDGLTAEQAYWRIIEPDRYGELQMTTFLRRSEVSQLSAAGTLPIPYVVVQDHEAPPPSEEIPRLPESLDYADFLMVWREVRGT
jgi:hypothetical protein